MNICQWNESECNQTKKVMRNKKGTEWLSKWCDKHYRIVVSRSMRRYPDRYIDKFGYVQIFKDGKRTAEHRVVLQEKIGRDLKIGGSAHHINGVRSDNRPENLELWVGGVRYGQRASEIVCHHCGEPYKI